MNLTNWTAKRAGGRITINGTQEPSGEPGKIVGVESITVPDGLSDLTRCIATDKNGNTHRLL